MPFIKCPECGNNASGLAESCPRCGYPIAKMDAARRKAEHMKKAPTPSCYNKT